MADTPEYAIPAPTQEEIDAMATRLGLLEPLDPAHPGVTMSRLRTFYPKTGWGHIQARLEALEAAGRAKRVSRAVGGSVPFEFWSLVEEE